MRTGIPVLVCLLAACKPPPPDLSSIHAELGALRQSLEEFRKLNQPRLDAIEAMDDLSREVKQLRQKVAAQPPAPPPSPVLAVQGAPLKTGDLMGGVGGTQPGVNDLYWVLSKIQVTGEERSVLCLYRAQADGRAFQLLDVRMLNLDQQIVELQSKEHRPSVADIQRALQKK